MKIIPRLLLLSCALLFAAVSAWAEPGKVSKPVTAQEYLDRILFAPEEVEQWLAEEAFPFSKYDAELGWLVLPMRRRDGANGSIASYNYDGPLGARRVINHADQPSRISTYGDSFTQCDQVSDGETWQEQLAAHLGEPVRNYGVGGYSVYQAYLRMRRVERELPSDVVILNIYDDDHYRNLDSWRNIRVSKHPLFIEPTLPHIRIDPVTGECIEEPNPCPTPESVRQLADPEWVFEQFNDDFVLQIMLAHQNSRAGLVGEISHVLMDRATTIGINTRIDEGKTISNAADALHTRAALKASMYVVGKFVEAARQKGKKPLIVLSFRARNVSQFLKDATRFDQEFVDFLHRENLDHVDLLEAHAADFKAYNLSTEDYVDRFYIGHYNPEGNAFTARAIRESLVKLLDPPPPAYHVDAGDYWKRR
jgi:hypothetical protein